MTQIPQRLTLIRNKLKDIKSHVGISQQASLPSLDTEILTDKSTLVTNLGNKGVQASTNESLASLVAKVDTIDIEPTVVGTNLIFNTHSNANVEGSDLQL